MQSFYQNLNIFKAIKIHIMKNIITFLCLTLLCISQIFSQQAKKVQGKIIKDYGETYLVDNPDSETEIDSELKVIFDVAKSTEDKSMLNNNLEFAARFLNMHANAGMKLEQLKAAMTVHADASHDVLNNEAYRAIYGVDNPNTKLINDLTEVGVDIVLCGQAAAKRNIKREDLNPNVKVALSATTAIIQYQNKGYQFVKY